jgi:hypothetical protein
MTEDALRRMNNRPYLKLAVLVLNMVCPPTRTNESSAAQPFGLSSTDRIVKLPDDG